MLNLQLSQLFKEKKGIKTIKKIPIFQEISFNLSSQIQPPLKSTLIQSI